MINKPKEECCGCTACASICPKNAITMQPDSLGFLYPEVNRNLCVECGLCDRVCSFNPSYDISENFEQPEAFAVRHKNLKEIETSRSGAAFIDLSDQILERGGVVYGVGYRDHFVVSHKRATTKLERDEFKGSKYVQSDLTDIYIQVKHDLLNGLPVLFSGTPCQIAGLKSFIGKKNRENLFLVDIVCHGVPSPFIWRDYLSYREKKEKDTVLNVDFRDKSFGWSTHIESLYFTKGKKSFNTFTSLFYRHIMLRKSCGNCQYANLKRPGDITIADFWGWEKLDKTFNTDNKGCSLVFINTHKGKVLFESCCNLTSAKIDNLEVCMQRNLIKPTKLNSRSLEFEVYYRSFGFEKTLSKFAVIGWRHQVSECYKKMRKFFKK